VRMGVALALSVAGAGEVGAAVVFYSNDPGGFGTAVSGLTFRGLEDFESSTLAPGNIAVLSDPLAPGVANGPFGSGTNFPMGLTVQSNTLGGAPATASPRGANGLATASAGYAGTPTDQVSNNNNGDSFDMLFGLSDTLGVSLIPLVFPTSGTGGGNATVRVYGAGDVLLNTISISVASYTNPTSYLGIVATGGDTIRRVNIFATDAGFDFSGADDIRVYTAATEPGIPEPGTWGMVALGCLAAGWLRRRG
jgi:hypothetical protein